MTDPADRLSHHLQDIDVQSVCDRWAQLSATEVVLAKGAALAAHPPFVAAVLSFLDLPQDVDEPDDPDAIAASADLATQVGAAGAACRHILVLGEALAEASSALHPDSQPLFNKRLRLVLGRAVVYVVRAALTELDREATRDFLTGLPNRRAFDFDLRRGTDRSKEDGSHLTVVSIDLDGLKAANKAGGHDGGDQLIRDTATLLSDSCQPGQTAYRFAGDEFALLLPGTSDEEAAGLLAAAQARPGAPAFSWGAATSASDGLEPDELWATADARMFDQKSAKKSAEGGTELPNVAP